MTAVDQELYDRGPGANWTPVTPPPRPTEQQPATAAGPEPAEGEVVEETDPDGWAALGLATGGLVALGGGVWLFAAGGWAAIITAGAVLAVAGGGVYAAREQLHRGGQGRGPRRRSSLGPSPSTGRLAAARRSGRLKGLGLGSPSRGKTAKASRLGKLGKAGKTAGRVKAGSAGRAGTPATGRKAAGRGFWSTLTAAGKPKRGGTTAGGAKKPGRVPPTRAGKTGGRGPQQAPRSRRGGPTLGRRIADWHNRRRARRWANRMRQPSWLQWWLMSVVDRLMQHLAQAGQRPGPTHVDATVGEPQRTPRPHGGRTGMPALTVAAAAAAASKPVDVVDDERDSDAWSTGGASTIPAHHRLEHHMSYTFAAHPAVQQVVEAHTTLFGTYWPRVEDGVDPVLDLEAFTLALGDAYRQMAADVAFFADRLRGEFPTHPGLADYFGQLSATFVASSEAASEAASAHRNLNAADFERRENPRPHEEQANVVPGVSY